MVTKDPGLIAEDLAPESMGLVTHPDKQAKQKAEIVPRLIRRFMII